MKVVMRATGIMLGAAALVAMAWASRAPMRLASEDRAIVRISLGARPERIERCVRQSDEELEKLAPQMRQRVICEGTAARYRLELRRGDEVLLSQTVRGGGLRNDRPLYVFREIPVPAGLSSLELRLTRIDTVAAPAEGDDDQREHEEREDADVMSGRDERDREERRRRRDQSVPAELELEIEETLAPGDVLLLTYDPATRSLQSIRRAAASPRSG
jgi:hypothetical protein